MGSFLCPTVSGSGICSAAGQGIFDQVIDIVEGDVVDGPLDLEEAGRFALKQHHEGGFNCENPNILIGWLFLGLSARRVCSDG